MKLQVGHGVVLGLLIREILTFVLKSLSDSMKASITNLLGCESCVIPRTARKMWQKLKQAWIWPSAALRHSSRPTPTRPELNKLLGRPYESPPKASESSLKISEQLDDNTSGPSSG